MNEPLPKDALCHCGRAKSEHEPVEDFPCPVTLEDLKRAIEAVPDAVADDDFVGHDASFLDLMDRMEAERDAWRMAANFIVQYVNVGGNGYREFMEGINIIREKLS